MRRGGVRRNTGERSAHRAGRAQIRAARRNAFCKPFPFVPASVYFSARYQAKIRRQQRLARRRRAIELRRLRRQGLQPFTPAQNAAFFRSLCKKPKRQQPPSPRPPHHVRKPHHPRDWRTMRSAGRPQRAVSASTRPRASRRPQRPRARRAR